MDTHRNSARIAISIGVGIALTLAACGDGDSADEPGTSGVATTTDPVADTGVVPTQPAAISVDDQESDGTTVTVAEVALPAPGFIAVHGDGGGSPGPVIGVSALLPAGTTSDVTITLDEPLATDAVVYPMVHVDTNDNGVYEFGTVDGVDGPGVTAAGDVAVVGAEIGVAAGDPDDTGDGDGDTGETGAAPGGDTITISNFAFDGVAEVTVGTTVVVTNTDASPHTWSAEDGTFDSGALGEGDTFEFTFTEVGEFAYFCNFHPSMTGTILVTG